MPEALLTPQEVATWLKMSRVWVYKQAEKGLLPFHRVGEAIRFDPEEIRTYLNDRRGVKRIYGETRNPKRRCRTVFLVHDQEVKNSGL
jgi:excisionase family DNA binding protein